MPRNCPSWLDTAVFYDVYPQSFYDSNGDGIGDLPGLIEKLDYIAWLGCNAIWLNPCYASPFRDAGYDIADYRRIAPRYGTNADAKRLFREAGKRGIRICLDLVVGHTSIDHPWFQESCRPARNKHSNWYVWTDSWLSFGGNSNLRLVAGYAPRDGCFAVNFFHSQPSLNFGFARPDPEKPWQLPTDHPDVQALRNEVKNIMRFWLDMGAAGFRCDMASSLVKNDPGCKATAAWWRDVRDMLDTEYPEAVLISEWGCPPQAVAGGFHIDFLSPHKDAADTLLFRCERHRNILHEMQRVEGRSFFDKDGQGDVARAMASYEKFYRKTKSRGYISIPTGNHDMSRISLGRTQRELEVVFAFIATMPGVPLIYYGDEIGMRYISDLVSKEGGYTRTGSRTPMQWSGGKNAGFSAAPPSKLYLPVDDRKNSPNVEGQRRNPNSLLNCVRRMLALRKETPALCADGAFEILYAKPRAYPFVYLRRRRRQRIVVALNPSKTPVNIRISVEGGAEAPPLLARGASLSGENGRYRLEMKGVSYGIFSV